MGAIVSAITGFSGVGVLPFLYQSAPKPSAAVDAIAQSLDASNDASGTSAPQAGATPPILTGFSAAPKLSADVIDALLKSQAQQSASNTPTPPGNEQAANLAGASTSGAGTTASNSSPNSPAGPESLQDIASQFDPHNLTHQQEEKLQGDLVSSGDLSQKDGLTFFSKTVLSDWFDSQHYRIINGQLVATTPSAGGTLIGNDAPVGPTHDVIARFQQSLAFDQSIGDTKGTAQDQKILNVLNQIEAIRNGSSASGSTPSSTA